MTTINTQLKNLRTRAGLSVRKLAALLDMPSSTYAAYEDQAKFKKPIIPLDLAKKLSAALSPHGIEQDEVMRLAGITGDLRYITDSQAVNADDEWLDVTGSVAAGVWKAQSDWPAREQYEVKFGKSKYPKEHRGAVRMDGLSMNLTILPGSDVEFLWVKFSPIPPKAGDLVIVERSAHDLVELTCKRLALEGDNYVLLCESSEPEFQEPIFIGRPDADNHSDEEVRVVGIVLSAKLDLAPKGLSERRYKWQ